jgi:hypothetical protein
MRNPPEGPAACGAAPEVAYLPAVFSQQEGSEALDLRYILITLITPDG